MRALRLSLLLSATLLAGCVEAPTAIESSRAEAVLAASPRSVPITAMSRNLYLGADLTPLFTLSNPGQIPFTIAALWEDVVVNDFPTRATALAEEIAVNQPQLIGLQEVAFYRLVAPGQPVVVLDYLAVLFDELRARGLDYRVTTSVKNIEVQFPIVTATGLGQIDYFLRDVILARADVQTSHPAAANFQVKLELSAAGVPIVIPRGWTAVDATWHGTTVRFVNTHLEAFHPAVNGAQAQELVAILANEPKSVILVGDINAGPGDPSNRPAYAIFQQAGFSDAWRQARLGDDGFTCCFADLLSETTRVPDQRIDVVLFRQPNHGGTGVDHVSALVTGAQPGDRVWSDRAGALLWPSDHAGIVATLQYREPRPVGR